VARNRDPFTQALASLRGRIENGEIAGGAPVIVQDEAERLRLSTTPVREALARLSGEGLVERAASGGYVAMRLDAGSIGDRFALQGEHLAFAIRLNARALGGRLPAPVLPSRDAPGTTVRHLFSVVVCSAGNTVLWEIWDRIERQLEVVRRLEPPLFRDLSEEAERLHSAWRDDLPGAFAEACAEYHARRIAAAGPLSALAAIRREWPETDQDPPGKALQT